MGQARSGALSALATARRPRHGDPVAFRRRQSRRRCPRVCRAHVSPAHGRCAPRTVIMVQVENEIGMIPHARDYSEIADRLIAGEVPAGLMTYLAEHRGKLASRLEQRWVANGARAQGTWEQVFGRGPPMEELFMAWHFATYVEAIAARGQARISTASVRQCSSGSSGSPAGRISERRTAAASDRRVAGGRAVDRFPRAGHLLSELRRVGAPVRASRQSAVHPGDRVARPMPHRRERLCTRSASWMRSASARSQSSRTRRRRARQRLRRSAATRAARARASG